MKVNLQLIALEQKGLLRKMLKVYEQELTEEDSPGEYKYLDLYWERENRKPYFITVNKIVSGFALVNRHTLIQKVGYNLAEFYIQKEFRNQGVGKEAAYKLFDMFPGKWETRQMSSNPKAQAFWNRVIAAYTNNHFEEVWLDDSNWRGAVQTFDTRIA
jgi:predicted acetyltransferase